MMKSRRPRFENGHHIVFMGGPEIWEMTDKEKEEYCQVEFGKSYDEYLRSVFYDYTPEQLEEARRQWEYPKPE